MRYSSSPTHRLRCVLGSALVPISLSASRATLAQGLPVQQDPTRGQGTGILQTLQNYSFDIVTLVALLIIASMFLGVAYHAYTTYSEIHTGRKTWGNFGLTVAVGALLLVLGIWLLTNATKIL